MRFHAFLGIAFYAAFKSNGVVRQLLIRCSLMDITTRGCNMNTVKMHNNQIPFNTFRRLNAEIQQ